MEFSTRLSALPTLEASRQQFFQILITEFTLSRRNSGAVELALNIADDCPAIWQTAAKTSVRLGNTDFETKAAQYQARLDEFLLEGQGTHWTFSDPDFGFRYANGGVLPIVRFGTADYYCLFFRDVFPIGWNIANGGSDGLDELLHPVDVIERELREELLIADPVNGLRYIFPGTTDRFGDQFLHDSTWRQWCARLTAHHGARVTAPAQFKDLPVPLKWLPGPDQLIVTDPRGRSVVTKDVYVNVNARDFGIELDRVVRLTLNDNCVMCDGEVEGPHAINAPVGLFPVDTFEREFARGSREYRPEIVFWNGQRFSPAALDRLIAQECWPAVRRLRTDQEARQFTAASVGGELFDLCPVTRSLVSRVPKATGAHRDHSSPTACDVFISFGGGDGELAAAVASGLKEAGLRVFCSEETPVSDWRQPLYAALESASVLVAVCRDPANIRRGWPAYEYTAFHSEICSGVKKEAKLLSAIAGFPRHQLPPPLCHYSTVEIGSELPRAVEELLTFIRARSH